ncbi:phage antirepressor KilAC domain-containing protein [Hoylesella nanceiensis]|uniref:phage antirepressor KilAC domain-containing protein n=1 Tax=Hoylesella nanceiensis TaxID=425941 RepID=UPI0024A7D14C|nr:phage antirepressor KilAC domain-containing protein [Hoylesella nanceiensis]
MNKNSSVLTMSSREIADLVESRHDSVKRTIERLQDKGLIQLTPMVEVKNHLGQVVTEYQLIKRDSYVVVAQLSPEFTARLVDRWQELENQQMPQIPQTLSEALRLAADQAEQIERQSLLLEQQRPKVEFVQRYVEAGTTKSLRETAKILRVPERAMIDCLVDDGLLFRQSGNLLPYQKYHAKGLFDVKTGTTEYGHNYTQTRVTSKGIEYIASRYASELM